MAPNLSVTEICQNLMSFAWLHAGFIVSLDLVHAVEEAIKASEKGDIVLPNIAHERIKKMYTWDKVATRTEKVKFFFITLACLPIFLTLGDIE